MLLAKLLCILAFFENVYIILSKDPSNHIDFLKHENFNLGPSIPSDLIMENDANKEIIAPFQNVKLENLKCYFKSCNVYRGVVYGCRYYYPVEILLKSSKPKSQYKPPGFRNKRMMKYTCLDAEIEESLPVKKNTATNNIHSNGVIGDISKQRTHENFDKNIDLESVEDDLRHNYSTTDSQDLENLNVNEGNSGPNEESLGINEENLREIMEYLSVNEQNIGTSEENLDINEKNLKANEENFVTNKENLDATEDNLGTSKTNLGTFEKNLNANIDNLGANKENFDDNDEISLNVEVPSDPVVVKMGSNLPNENRTEITKDFSQKEKDDSLKLIEFLSSLYGLLDEGVKDIMNT